jgi:putative ABC transport system permease protein
MATIGIVSLPGMMTDVILGGSNLRVAIEYQIAIMLAIFCGTAITVLAAILLTLRSAFSPSGILDTSLFRD